MYHLTGAHWSIQGACPVCWGYTTANTNNAKAAPLSSRLQLQEASAAYILGGCLQRLREDLFGNKSLYYGNIR